MKKRLTRRVKLPANTLATVIAELQSLRRDMVVLGRIIVEGQKLQRRSVQQQLQAMTKAGEQPGYLSNTVLGTSFYDPLYTPPDERPGRL